MNILNNLDEVLENEILLFQKIYEIEQEKKEALLTRDAERIDNLSYQQDKYVSQLNKWEEKRDKIQKAYALHNFKHNDQQNITLSDIAKNEKSSTGKQLLKKGHELKEMMLTVSRLQDLNRKMIKDNLDMIGAVLNEIKEQGTVHMGYDHSGKEKGKVSNSVLFNKTV